MVEGGEMVMSSDVTNGWSPESPISFLGDSTMMAMVREAIP